MTSVDVIELSSAARLIAYVLLAASALGAALLTLQAVLVRRWAARPAPPPAPVRPPMSVLRPLAGADPDLERLLVNALQILGPSDELVLGVAATLDPALPVARRVAAMDPARVRVVLTRPDDAVNPKIAQLIGMTEAARTDMLVVSDANVWLREDHLDGIAAYLLNPEVGLVTHPVSGAEAESVASLFETLHLGVGIGAGVVAAKELSGQDLVVGKSMAMRRETLEQIGGWVRFSDVLAEDYLAGRYVTALGLRVAIARGAVVQPSRRNTMRGVFDRFGRWSTMQRFAVGLPIYTAQLLLSPVALAMGATVLWPTSRALCVLVAVAIVRIGTDVLALRALGVEVPPVTRWPLMPLRDLGVVVCWIRGLLVRHVVWRGHKLLVHPGTRLTPAPAAYTSRDQSNAAQVR